MPLVSFSNSWKHQKTSDVSRGYRNKPMAWNGLDTKNSYAMVQKILEHLPEFLEGITLRTDDCAKLKICIFTHYRHWSENLQNFEEYFLTHHIMLVSIENFLVYYILYDEARRLRVNIHMEIFVSVLQLVLYIWNWLTVLAYISGFLLPFIKSN